MKELKQIPFDVLLMGCEVELIDNKNVKLYVDNLSCEGSFYVSFSKSRRKIKLNWLEGNVIDLQRFKDAREVASQILKSK